MGPHRCREYRPRPPLFHPYNLRSNSGRASSSINLVSALSGPNPTNTLPPPPPITSAAAVVTTSPLPPASAPAAQMKHAAQMTSDQVVAAIGELTRSVAATGCDHPASTATVWDAPLQHDGRSHPSPPDAAFPFADSIVGFSLDDQPGVHHGDLSGCDISSATTHYRRCGLPRGTPGRWLFQWGFRQPPLLWTWVPRCECLPVHRQCSRALCPVRAWGPLGCSPSAFLQARVYDLRRLRGPPESAQSL